MIRFKKNNPLNLAEDTLYRLYSDHNVWMCFFFENDSKVLNFMIRWSFDLESKVSMSLNWKSEDNSFFFDRVVTSPDGDIGQTLPCRDLNELSILIEYIEENQGDLEETLFVFFADLVKRGEFTDLERVDPNLSE